MVANIIFYDFPLGYFKQPEADTLYIISMISHVDLKPRPSFTVLSAAAAIPHTLGQIHVNVTRFFFIFCHFWWFFKVLYCLLQHTTSLWKRSKKFETNYVQISMDELSILSMQLLWIRKMEQARWITPNTIVSHWKINKKI